MVGLEPTRDKSRKILSLLRKPFRHITIIMTALQYTVIYHHLLRLQVRQPIFVLKLFNLQVLQTTRSCSELEGINLYPPR